MLTWMLLEPFDIFKRGVEQFNPAELSPAGPSRASPEELRFAMVRLLVFVILIGIAISLASKCKDQGLNYAMILSDPTAYILGRLLFGRC